MQPNEVQVQAEPALAKEISFVISLHREQQT
jgi:hypothetical protein